MLLPKLSNLRIALSIAIVIAALSVTQSTYGATFTVTNANNTGAGSLRQAIADAGAAGSDTITFDPAFFNVPRTIVLATGLNINTPLPDSLTIVGPGANLLTLDGNNAVRILTNNSIGTNFGALSISGMTLTRAVGSAIDNRAPLTLTNVVFEANTSGSGGAIVNSTDLTVTGCTFTNNISNGGGATGNGGGAIYNSTSSPELVSITDSTFTNNQVVTVSALSGGAIRNRFGTMTIANSTFSNNSSVNSAGAISSGENLTITGSTFTGNTAIDNAGAISSGGTTSISNSQFNGNSAGDHGGGLFLSGTVTIANTTVSGNTANSNSDTTGNGGGLYSNGATATISGSTISGNSVLGSGTSAGNGGGIDSDGPLNVTNSTISGNTAGRIGGGIRATGVSTAIVNIESSTIVNNTAALTGGGIVRGSSSNPVNLHNSIFANNTDNGTAPDVQGTVVSQGYNLIESTTGATITGVTTGNITGQDPDLGPLADNSGPTFTHAPLAGSPAVEAADPANFPAADQRGVARPQNGDFTGAALPDIGAYEVMGPTAAPVLITGRVFADGRPVRGAIVTLMAPSGGYVTSVTNSFGYFRFTDVDAGESYILSVAAKRYRFESQLVNADADVTGIVFEAARPRFDPPRGAAKPAAGPSTGRSAPPVPVIPITRRKSNELEMH